MNRVALVTGSTSGIGEATARRLAADGLTVVIHSRNSQDAGLKLAEELGGTYLRADLENEDEAAGLIPRALAAHGRLDVLVNNAGISWPVPHAELDGLSAADWRRLLDVNLIAPWLLCTAALPALRVNAVAPGLVDTAMTADWTAAQELWKTSSPMRRAAQPSDVADLIAAILQSSYLTGEVILLDGGLNLR